MSAAIARPLTKSTQRSAYRASRSASMVRATTSPGGVRRRRCWFGLAEQDRGADAEHDGDPPPRVEPERRRQEQRRDQQRRDQGGRQRSRAVSPLESDDQVTPDPARHRAEGAGDGGGQEEHEAHASPTAGSTSSADERGARQARHGRELGRRRAARRYGGRCRPARSRPAAAGSCSSADASSRERNGPASAARLRARALLDDAAAVEHRDLLGALGRRQPVGDQQPGASGEQPVGGAHDVGLGDRVHPGGRLVEDDDAHVADQQPGEGDQLLLPGRQGRAAGAEQGVEPVGQAGDPVRRGRARRPRPRRRSAAPARRG